jgi:NAD(P)H-nitrite reductase large subunit
MKRHVILGGGVAGRRAAEVIRKRSAETEIVVVEEQEEAFYYRPMLGELLAGRSRPEQILTKQKDRLSQLGVQVLTGTRVTALDMKAEQVVLSSGERLSFDKLLIASGSKTMRVAGDDGKGRGVVYLDTLPEVLHMASLLESVRKAVICGASFQAISAVRGLRARGIDCTLLLPEERFWPGVLDPVASEILEDRLKQEGVALIRQAEIADLVWEDSELKAVVPSKGEKLPAGLLVVAGQQAPRLEGLENSDLLGENGVRVDENLRTSHEKVFAAGDVAALPGTYTEEAVPQPGWLSAWRQGNVAGLNMLGQGAAYKGFPSLRTKALDVDVVCLGLSDVRGDDVREESGDYPYEELPYIYKKIVYKGQKVAGAVFMGDASEAGAVEGWIRRGLKADECDKKVLNQMFQPRVQSFSALGALCPICKFQIQVEEQVEEGSVVTCPACGADFSLQRMPNGAFRARLYVEP